MMSIAKMTQHGIFVGDNQYFYPDNTLTRAQMAKIFVQAFHLTGTSTHSFNDVSPNMGPQLILVYFQKIKLPLVIVMEHSNQMIPLHEQSSLSC